MSRLGTHRAAVAMLLVAVEFVCLRLLALLRFHAAGLVLSDLQLQRLLVVLGVALTTPTRSALTLGAPHRIQPVGMDGRPAPTQSQRANGLS